MNNAAKVEAFKSFYLQAQDIYAQGDLEASKPLFIKAASLANDISLSSLTYDTRMEYHAQASKILRFLKNDFGKEKQVINAPKEEEHIFQEEDLSDNKVTFDDVAGLDDVKDEIIYNVIEPLRNPELAKKYNIKPGAKILLYGPPGTGKTFIARAIAGEVDAKFYAINCQDLISKYVGDSSKRIDALFNEAESHKRAIIFFDEFDAIASSRNDSEGNGGELARFVASFLTKVDGFKKSNTCEMLLLIAATNRPWAIDSAMLRGGRFDNHIYVGLPDKEARLFLVRKELQDIRLDSSVSYMSIANKLENYGGADIVSACKKIAQLAYRRAIKSCQVVPIKEEDVNQVISNMHVTISKEELNAFEAFRKGSL